MIQKKKQPTGKNLHVIIGMPVRAMPNQEANSFYVKRDKMVDGTPRRLCMSHSPFNGANFCGEVIPSHLVNRFGSWFGTNNKLSRGVIGPISTTNDYLNTAYNDVVCLCGSCRNNALSRSPWEKIWLVAILSQRVKSLSLQERNNAICRLPRQIQTYSLG